MWWLSATTGPKIWCKRSSFEAAWKDPGIHKGPATLGQGSCAPMAGHAVQDGRVCWGTLAMHGALNHIQRWGGSYQGSSITLGDGNPLLCCKVVGEEVQEATRAQSHSIVWRTHSQGSNPPLLGCCRHLIIPATPASTPTTPSRWTGTPDIFMQQVSIPLGSPVEPKPTCPPGFTDIARSLLGDDNALLSTSNQCWQPHQALWWGLPWPLWCLHGYDKTPWWVPLM